MTASTDSVSDNANSNGRADSNFDDAICMGDVALVQF